MAALFKTGSFLRRKLSGGSHNLSHLIVLSTSELASAPYVFLPLHGIEEFMRYDCQMMCLHENLFADIMRFYLDTIDHVGFA